MSDRPRTLATVYSALNAGDIAALRAHVVPNVEIVERLEVPGGVELHGVEEIGIRAIADVTIRLRGKGSGAEVGERLAHLVDFEGDKVARWRAFSDLDEARTAAMKEEIAELYELWAAGRLDDVIPRLHPEIVWAEPKDTIGARAGVGTDRAYEGVTQWEGSFDSYRGEIRDIESVGRNLVVDFVQHIRAGGSSVELATEVFHVWGFRDGLPARMEMFFEREQAVEAARR